MPGLAPASGRCSVSFLPDLRDDPLFLLPHKLKGADPQSRNQYNTHFKLDGRRLWLYQQIALGGALESPAYFLRRTVTYKTAELRKVVVEKARFDGDAFQITMEVSGPPESYDNSTVPSEIMEQQGYDTLTFPLHIMSRSPAWRIIRLITETRANLKKFSIPAATSLLLGNTCYHPSIDQDTWIKNQQKAIAKEAEYTRKSLQRFSNVNAECVRILNWILVKITFNTPLAAQNLDEQFMLNNLAQKYMIKGPTGSILSPEMAVGYDTRTGTTVGFTGAVVTYDKHSDCAVQLRLLQKIPRHELFLFHNQVISGVDLVPSDFDKTKEESDLAHRQLAKVFEIEETRNIVSLLSDAPQSVSGPSARKIFLAGELPLIENIYDDGTQWEGRLKHPDMLRQRAELKCWNRLDQWQRKAIKTSDEYPISLIHGPPGTGKTSTVVTYILARLTRNLDDRIMVCSPRNVAVHVLVQSAAAAMKEDNLKYADCPIGPFPIVHLETEGVIDIRYLCGRGKSVGEHHIQSIRIRVARHFRQPAFIRGVEVLERDGYISDAKEWKNYKEERDFLTAKIMSKVRVVFVTTSSAASTSLKYVSPLPNILIIDECGCAKPQDLAIPMMALGSSLKRIVLSGDPSQLPPLVFSKEARDIWSKTLFAELMERGFKTTRLNTEYRSHSHLYEITSQLFYQGTVQSHHDTLTNPPPMLTTLTANLPRPVPQQGSRPFQITGYSHFFNLRNGKCIYAPGGGCENPAEAKLVVSIARSLCEIPGISEGDIMVLSGYIRQVYRIERELRESGVYDIRVKTVDGSQADDAAFIILSTVRAQDNDLGFMQFAARTNVATSRQKIALYIVGDWRVVIDRPRNGKPNFLGKYVEHAQSMWPDYVLDA